MKPGNCWRGSEAGTPLEGNWSQDAAGGEVESGHCWREVDPDTAEREVEPLPPACREESGEAADRSAGPPDVLSSFSETNETRNRGGMARAD